MSPEEVVFSATTASFDVVVSATEDATPELRDTLTVSLTPPADTPAITSALSVIVPADSDTPIVHVRVDRTIIPEGTTVSAFIDAVLNRELNISMPVSGLMGSQTDVIFSPPSLSLSPNNSSASFNISVRDNEEPQGDNRTFNVDLTAMSAPRPELPSLTFTIPPNDLTAYAAMRAEFKIEETEQTLAINITPPLEDSKTFLVFSEDPRLAVNTGIITPAESLFHIELALSEGTVLGREEQLSLNIIHLDSWQPLAQPSAQAQISAGLIHSCAIKADSGVVCWGNQDDGRSNPLSSPQGVDANAGFLSVSAGVSHGCGIQNRQHSGMLGF